MLVTRSRHHSLPIEEGRMPVVDVPQSAKSPAKQVSGTSHLPLSLVGQGSVPRIRNRTWCYQSELQQMCKA
jgi:hypothetical protein